MWLWDERGSDESLVLTGEGLHIESYGFYCAFPAVTYIFHLTSYTFQSVNYTFHLINYTFHAVSYIFHSIESLASPSKWKDYYLSDPETCKLFNEPAAVHPDWPSV